jgi:hypothetical protein
MLTAGTADQKSERRPRTFPLAIETLAAAATLLFSSVGRAQPTSLSAQLDYASEAPCPDRVAFMRSVEARVGRSVQWGSGGFAFQVNVSRQGEEFRGHLLARSGQYVTERDLAGKNCEDVVAGLALVAALALDPNASTAPQRAQSTEGQGVLPEIAKPAQPAQQEPQKPAPPPATPKPAPAPPAPTPPPPLPPPPPFLPGDDAPASYAISVLGTLGVDVGPAPVALIPLGPKVLAELYSDSIWQPSFGLAFGYAKTGFIGSEDGFADFRWLVVRLSVCPLGSEIVREGRLRACVLGDIGSMSAEGRTGAVAVTERTTQFWAASGAGATFSYHPVSPWFLEIGAGALIAWTQPTYLFVRPDNVVHEVPPFAFTAQIGVGVSFSDQ